jgi:hypothetical protein
VFNSSVVRSAIRTPDQRLRVFISSTLREFTEERNAAREAIEHLRLSPVMFELGARPHPPGELYRAYLGHSHADCGFIPAGHPMALSLRPDSTIETKTQEQSEDDLTLQRMDIRKLHRNTLRLNPCT